MTKKTGIEPVSITLRRAAMNLLARREQSFVELQQKLAQKYPQFDLVQDIIPVLERLREESLQSDSRFVEAYVRYRSTRGVGPLKISAELQPRRLDTDLLQQALYRDGPDWFELCGIVLQKKFRPVARPDLQEKQRWFRFLQQRGFTQEQIAEAISALPPEAAGRPG